MDKLQELFKMQEALNRRCGVNVDHMHEADKPDWILKFSRAMMHELIELENSVPWKHWAKYQHFDKQNARVEVVDMLHFLISLAQVLDMSADDLYQAYLKKHEVNVQRQESGYATKDEADCKHI